ncbi:hypothetical protein PQX77_020852 [Marasmius sp. AFHP31]|nr:hypothetical protein PQX77_020852 [Marasmius sp. AFHP31]
MGQRDTNQDNNSLWRQLRQFPSTLRDRILLALDDEGNTAQLRVGNEQTKDYEAAVRRKDPDRNRYMWVGRIVEMRGNEDMGYLILIRWWYSGEHAAGGLVKNYGLCKGTRLANQMADYEVMLSRHVDVVDIVTVLDEARIVPFNELDPVWLPRDQWITRNELDIIRSGTATREPTLAVHPLHDANCSDQYNPDRDAQIYCGSCYQWYSVDDLADGQEDRPSCTTMVQAFIQGPVIRGRGWKKSLCGNVVLTDDNDWWLSGGTLQFVEHIRVLALDGHNTWPSVTIQTDPHLFGEFIECLPNLELNVVACRDSIISIKHTYVCRDCGDII